MRLMIASVLLFGLLRPESAEAFPFKRKKPKQPETVRWGMTKQEREKAIKKGLQKNRAEANRSRSKVKPVAVRAKSSQ
ncbi:MAG: hypothetical protein JNL98_31475 [Bryobacterales bacterium]|nr:hypothetical protein [Bryobacterales bacterium]